MSEREIYHNAPVVLVAVEARHPETDTLSTAQQSQLASLLISRFPLPQPIQVQKVTGTIGGSSSVVEQKLPRYAGRDQMTSVTFSAEAVVVETTKHLHFEHLLDLVHVAIEARQKVAPVQGLMRVGLRYVNEIRVPDLDKGTLGWHEWVDISLLGPIPLATELELVPEQWQGAAMFDRGEGRKLIVRYGPREGYAFPPGGPLQRPTPSPGTFFLLDIDSFWVPDGEVPEFTTETINQFCTDLHEPVHQLFEKLITERLREEVLRRA